MLVGGQRWQDAMMVKKGEAKRGFMQRVAASMNKKGATPEKLGEDIGDLMADDNTSTKDRTSLVRLGMKAYEAASREQARDDGGAPDDDEPFSPEEEAEDIAAVIEEAESDGEEESGF